MSLAGGKVLAVHRLFAKASEVKDGASELTVWTFPALELETYTKFKAAVESFKDVLTNSTNILFESTFLK